MQRMLERLGGDSSLEGAASLSNDPAALDKLFERMQANCTIAPVCCSSQPTSVSSVHSSRLGIPLTGCPLRLQDPEVLEKVAALAKNESFQAKVQELAQNEKFTSAAGQYAEEMKKEVFADHKAGYAEDLSLGIEMEDETEEEDEDE